MLQDAHVMMGNERTRQSRNKSLFWWKVMSDEQFFKWIWNLKFVPFILANCTCCLLLSQNKYIQTVWDFKLLDPAGMDIKVRRLLWTACNDQSFISLKSVWKRTFGGKEPVSSTMRINAETTHIMNHRQEGKKTHTWNDQQKTPLPGTNLMDRFGDRSQCGVCQSKFHRAKDYLLRAEQVKMTEDSRSQDLEECNITVNTRDWPTEAEIFRIVLWLRYNTHLMLKDCMCTEMAP